MRAVARFSDSACVQQAVGAMKVVQAVQVEPGGERVAIGRLVEPSGHVRLTMEPKDHVPAARDRREVRPASDDVGNSRGVGGC